MSRSLCTGMPPPPPPHTHTHTHAHAVKYICNHAELAAVACSVAVLGKMLEVLPECPTVRLVVSTCYQLCFVQWLNCALFSGRALHSADAPECPLCAGTDEAECGSWLGVLRAAGRLLASADGVLQLCLPRCWCAAQPAQPTGRPLHAIADCVRHAAAPEAAGGAERAALQGEPLLPRCWATLPLVCTGLLPQPVARAPGADLAAMRQPSPHQGRLVTPAADCTSAYASSVTGHDSGPCASAGLQAPAAAPPSQGKRQGRLADWAVGGSHIAG